MTTSITSLPIVELYYAFAFKHNHSSIPYSNKKYRRKLRRRRIRLLTSYFVNYPVTFFVQQGKQMSVRLKSVSLDAELYRIGSVALFFHVGLLAIVGTKKVRSRTKSSADGAAESTRGSKEGRTSCCTCSQVSLCN